MAGRRAVRDFVSERDVLEEALVLLDEVLELLVALEADLDVIRDLIAIFLAHRLDLADDLADKALFEQLFAERRLQRNRHAVVALAVEALRLGHRDLDVFRQ